MLPGEGDSRHHPRSKINRTLVLPDLEGRPPRQTPCKYLTPVVVLGAPVMIFRERSGSPQTKQFPADGGLKEERVAEYKNGSLTRMLFSKTAVLG